MNFKSHFQFNEAFDKPYRIRSIVQDGELTTYTFDVDDVDDPYVIEAAFSDDRILSNFINRSSQPMYDQYIAEHYPDSLKPNVAKVHELGFMDKETGSLVKNFKSGHSVMRTMGTILTIVRHYIVSKQPHVIMFTGAKEENRGDVYDKIIRYALRAKEFPTYFYFKEDYKNDTRFWIFDSSAVPYMDDETFQEMLEIELSATADMHRDYSSEEPRNFINRQTDTAQV